MKTEIDEILAELEVEETAPIEVITTDLIDPTEEEIPVEIEVPAEEMEDDVLIENKPIEEPKFEIGDEVKLIAGATFASGGPIPSNLFNTKLYVRQIKNGNCAISIKPTGRISGSVKSTSLTKYTDFVEIEDDFDKYYILVKADSVDIKSKPTTNSKTLKTAPYHSFYCVIGEKDGWGHLRTGGWIPLDCARKLD
jgi:hypothetical protein